MSSTRTGGTALVSSLVSCLRFAAPLVRSDATAQQMCTQATLGTLVVDAHRLAQQAGSQHLDKSDPRRILSKIAALDDQLCRVGFNDITWDSEGIAAQSLEMELQDIEERASVSALRNFCVLLVVTGSSGSHEVEESALLWFPLSEHNNSKKYLLYVVPGRIKIVKTMGELIKKMFEEIHSLRESSATYQVWTLMERKEKNKHINHVKPAANTSPTSNPKSKVISSPANEHECEERPEHGDCKSKRQEESTATACSREPQPLRVRALNKESVVQESMFQFFGGKHVEHPSGLIESQGLTRSPSPVRAQSDVSDKLQNAVELSTSPTSTTNPLQQGWRCEKGVSTSHINARKKAESDQSVYEVGAAWRSLDGTLKPPKAIDQLVPPVAATPSFIDADVIDRSRIRPQEHRVHEESMFQFSSSRVLERPSHEARPTSVDSHPLEVVNSDTQLNSGCSATDAVTDATTEHTYEHADEKVEQPDLSNLTKPKKKRSARDHYRNKLGARGWWELEYQATKMLQQQASDARVPATLRAREDRRIESAPANREVLDRALLSKAIEIPLTRNRPISSGSDFRSVTSVSLDNDAQLNMTPHRHEAFTEEAPQQEQAIETRVKPVAASSRHNHLRVHDAWQVQPSHANGTHNGENPLQRSETAPVPIIMPPTVTETNYDELEPRVYLNQAMSPRDRNYKVMMAAQDPKVKTQIMPPNESARLPTRPASPSRLPETTAEHKSRDLSARTEAKNDVYDPKPSSSTSFTASQSHGEQDRQQLPTNRFRDIVLRADADDEQDSVLMATMRVSNRVASESAIKVYGDRDIHRADSKQDAVRDEETAKSFNVHGRVPIRQRPESKPMRRTSIVSSDDEDAEITCAPMTTHQQMLRAMAPHVEPSKPQGPPRPEPFTVGSPGKCDGDSAQSARQQKLAELRQRKIQQLQKARDKVTTKRVSHADPHQPTKAPDTSTPAPVAHSQPPPREAFETHKPARAALPAAPPPTTTTGTVESFATVGHARARKPSNRKLIQNAIEYTLLAGGSLDKERNAAVQALMESPCDNFIVLLKSAKELKFRALYEHHIERNRVVRIFSVASSSPPVLTDDVISQFFRYNSGKKAFAPIDSREFTVKTDACALVDQLVFKKKTISRLL